MILSWVAVTLFVFGAFSKDHLGIGKRPLFDYKKVHESLKIINGNKTSITKYPFISSLQKYGEEFGAAVILNKRWLLTTAFNLAGLQPEDLQFRVGSIYHSDKGQVLKAAQVIQHPNYTGSWDYDIAVIKTDKPIKFNKKVKAIKLASKDLAAGTKAYVAGWGMPSESQETPSKVLLETSVTVMDWGKCAKVYQSHLTPRLMCTFDKKTGPCWYDYGDPLVVDNVLYGLYAGAYSCKPGFYPILYADIPPLAPWVYSVITNDTEGNLKKM